MLFKLLKYDFKSMLRTFLPLWGIVLLFSLGNFVFPTEFPWEGSSPIAILVMTALLVAVVTITVILVIQRFYHGLLKDEGYLMFTLPVKTWQLVLSKYFTATSIVLLSGTVSVLATTMLVTKGWFNSEEFTQFFSGITGELLKLFILSGLSVLFSILSSIALIYLSMAVGHLFYKLRVPISIAAYIAISTVVSQLKSLLFGYQSQMINVAISHTLPTDELMNLYSAVSLELVFSLLITIIYLALTILILNKRLNLE